MSFECESESGTNFWVAVQYESQDGITETGWNLNNAILALNCILCLWILWF